MSKTDQSRARHLSVGVAQARGAFKYKTVSNTESLVTTFCSKPPRRIDPLDNEGQQSSPVNTLADQKAAWKVMHVGALLALKPDRSYQ